MPRRARTSMSRRSFLSTTAWATASAALTTTTLLGPAARRATAASRKITLRLSHAHAPDPLSIEHANAMLLQELVSKKTDNQLDLRIFPANQLGEERSVAEGVKMGTIDIMLTATAIWTNLAPKLGLFDLPYLFTSFEQARKILMGPATQELTQYLEQTTGVRNVEYMGAFGFRNVATRSKEVKTVEDLKGLKIRVIQNPIYIRTFELLGARPTPMAFGEVFIALQSGVLDGWEHDPPTMANMKMYEVTKYLARTEHIFTPCGIFANAKKIDALPLDLKKGFLEAAKESCTTMFEVAPQKQEEGLKLLRDKGMVITPFDKAPAIEKVKGYWQEYAEKIKATDILAKIVS